jgi:site-specific recombinase XerC
MSQKRKLVHAAHGINNQSGGARSTKMARLRHLKEFISHCADHKLGMTDFKSVTREMLVSYVQALKAPNHGRPNSTATIHNKLAAIRTALKSHGVDLKALGIENNADLEIGSRTRLGKKEPISDAAFEAALAKAMDLGELGFFHCIRLERYLGLRGLEAVMSTAALSACALEAVQMAGKSLKEVKIFDGTKGGRPRETAVIVKFARETLSVIAEALKFATNNDGYLVSGKVSGLKQARARYHKIAIAVGLTGKSSPHALRYRYTCDKLEELRDLGVPRQEALVLASKWLGHGPGRGRWVSMVYGRSVMTTYKKTTRRNSQQVTLEHILGMLDAEKR